MIKYIKQMPRAEHKDSQGEETLSSGFAVYGHGDHTFKIRLSDLPRGILPNAPECKVYEDGKRCEKISEFIKIIPSGSQT